eukprot:TRINITY_DN23983_c0_g1_i2.p1 TRINITY_DN23983_c0_g1~~TRINITY_DN23983_c0_g1_i2.p1  ORF type:complete len:129 (+),score=54.75 TRINITY_DN23983_c0_g1_i2:45-431(+)
MIRRPPRSTLSSSSAASDVYKRQVSTQSTGKQRELEKQRASILQERSNTAAGREDTMAKLKDAIAAKKEALRKMQMDKLKRQQERQEYEATGATPSSASSSDEEAGGASVRDTVSDVADELKDDNSKK